VVRIGAGGKEGEKAILDEILPSGKGKTLRGIINFHSMLTDHVEPPLEREILLGLLNQQYQNGLICQFEKWVVKIIF